MDLSQQLRKIEENIDTNGVNSIEFHHEVEENAVLNVEYGEFKIEVIVNEIPSVDYTYEIIFYKYMESYFYDDIDEVIAKITNELEGVEVE